MKNQTSRYRLTRQNAGRLAGALGLLLALCLVAGGVVPVHAGPPPTMPHAFYGDVTVNSAPVANGTPVAAYVGGAWAAETTVAGGMYSLDVPGTAGAAVTFHVGGVLANEPATTWQSGALTNLDLTIDTPPVPAPTVVGAATNAAGTVITITFSKNMADPAGKHGEFKYKIGGGADQAFSAAALNADNTKVDLTCAGTAIAYGNTVTVSYTKNNTVVAADGGVLESFTDQAVTNNMPSPPPPVTQKLIGMDDDTLVTNHSPNYFHLDKFTAVATGNLTQFKLRCGAIGNVKIALYADDAGNPGHPGALIATDNTGTAVTVGWNTISFPSTLITSGTTYWLAFNSDVFCVGWVSSGELRVAYKVASYDGFSFPNPAGTGFSSNYITPLIAGWGTIVTPEPPTRDCSTLTFRWNASTGATKYHLQVNTSANFDGTDMFNDEVGDITHAVTGLTAGTTYYYRIRAGNAAGWSGWSSTGEMRCGGVPPV